MNRLRLHVLLSAACALVCLISPAWSWPMWWPSRVGRRCRHGYDGSHDHDHHHHHCGGGGGGNPDKHRNFNTISSIYNLTVYPHQLPIFQGGAAAVPPGLFSQNVAGRVDPVGDFVGFEHSIEYFFALAPIPQGNAASAAITSYQITEFSSACPEVAASVVYLYCNVQNPGFPNDGKALAPLKQVAFWRFDEQGAVLKYDAWIPNLNSWLEVALGSRISNTQYQMQSIQQICVVTQIRCTGANTQWSSIGECIASLSQKTYGTYDEVWGDNVVCRTVHLVLTQSRPDAHCPHVGPTGGGKCVDIEYPKNYFGDEKLYGDPTGSTFMCN